MLIDQFLEDAIEVDVDCHLPTARRCVIGGIMEHIEEAGIHSGDSACVHPAALAAGRRCWTTIRDYSRRLAPALNVLGLMNMQFAVKDGEVYVLEVNPRASRTVPFVSKAIGVPLAKLAAKVMAGATLRDLGLTTESRRCALLRSRSRSSRSTASPAWTPLLGPEMKSTGEVMGIDPDFGIAFAKSQFGAGQPAARVGHRLHLGPRPRQGAHRADRPAARRPRLQPLRHQRHRRGAQAAGVSACRVCKVHEGRPNVVDMIKNREIQLIINTPLGRRGKDDQLAIRREALVRHITTITTIPGAAAAVTGIESLARGALTVKSLQEYHAGKTF